MRVKCEFIIFPGMFFLYDVQTQMVIASGSEKNVSLRHSPRHLFPGGEPCTVYCFSACLLVCFADDAAVPCLLFCFFVGRSARLALNIAVDLGAIAASVFLVRRDLAAQDARMTRMEIGAKLAGLKVRMQV